MSSNALLAPLLVQVALTIAIYLLLSRRKNRAVAAGEVDEARRALDEAAWPANVRQVNNNLRNQFELPVLFYALVLTHVALAASHWSVHIAAWLFVASRVLHAWVHVTSNVVRIRRRIFTIGVVMVLILLLQAAVAMLR
jgi:hypothetical protein